MNRPLPVPRGTRRDPTTDVAGVIERVIADVPPARTREVPNAAAVADRIARTAAQKAALVSGSLALPPGPMGLVTVLPDLYVIWKLQRQMIADVFALYGRSAELTRTHMLYCLFRHMASHVVRDFAVRAGQRVVIEQLTSGALRHTLAKLGATVTRRIAGAAATRWVPLAGAAAVGAYAYWDTLQVANTALRLLESEADGARAEPGAAIDPARPDAARA
jgi:hypothetical protein